MKLKELLPLIPDDQKILIFSGGNFSWTGLCRQFLEQQYMDRTVYHIRADKNLLEITI